MAIASSVYQWISECVFVYICFGIFLCVCMHVSLRDRWTDRTREQHRLGFCTLVCMCVVISIPNWGSVTVSWSSLKSC